MDELFIESVNIETTNNELLFDCKFAVFPTQFDLKSLLGSPPALARPYPPVHSYSNPSHRPVMSSHPIYMGGHIGHNGLSVAPMSPMPIPPRPINPPSTLDISSHGIPEIPAPQMSAGTLLPPPSLASAKKQDQETSSSSSKDISTS